MKKTKQLTIEEHKECMDKLALAQHLIGDVFNICQKRYYKSSALMRAFRRFTPYSSNNVFIRILARLNDELQYSNNYNTNLNLNYDDFSKTSLKLLSKLPIKSRKILSIKDCDYHKYNTDNFEMYKS